MNLIKKILFCLLIILLNSCDTYSTLWVENNTNNAITIIATGNSIPTNDNLKIIQEIDDEFTYELSPQKEHELFGIVNASITKENIPFDKLVFINVTDTLQFNNRSEIFNAMIENSTDYYSIIIK